MTIPRRPPSIVAGRAVAFVVPLSLLGGALVSQLGFGLVPCEMCLWQRWPHVAALLFAGLAFAVIDDGAVRWLVAFAGGALLTTAAIGGYHAGVEYGWWTGPACSAGPGGSLAEILARPVVACDRAQWTLGGVSLAGFNFLVSLTAGIAVFALLVTRTAATPRAVAA